MIPDINDIKSAHELIKNYIHRTPVMSSRNINSITECDIYFKCENFQKVGAFKFRGACNSVFSLSDEQAKNGVATHSSGNHAAALALAAKMKGIPAYIVMPKNAPQVKKDAVASYGANIIFCEPTLSARESTLDEVVAKTGAEFIHPYNNYKVIAGQGTAALELMDEISGFDIIMSPVGGGGLLSGTSITAKFINPGIKVIAGEPDGANDAWQSLMKGEIVPSVNPQTIADGLLTSLGDKTFEIIKQNVDEIITVKEDTILFAMKLVWERMKIIIEPSSAVPLAAILERKEKFTGKKVGIIISGGNVDLGKIF